MCAGWDEAEAVCWEVAKIRDGLAEELASAVQQTRSGGVISVQLMRVKHEKLLELHRAEQASKASLQEELAGMNADREDLSAALQKEERLRNQALERLSQMSRTARLKEEHLLHQLALATGNSLREERAAAVGRFAGFGV